MTSEIVVENKQTDRLDTNPWLSTAESYVVLKIAKNPW